MFTIWRENINRNSFHVSEVVIMKQSMRNSIISSIGNNHPRALLQYRHWFDYLFNNRNAILLWWTGEFLLWETTPCLQFLLERSSEIYSETEKISQISVKLLNLLTISKCLTWTKQGPSLQYVRVKVESVHGRQDASWCQSYTNQFIPLYFTLLMIIRFGIPYNNGHEKIYTIKTEGKPWKEKIQWFYYAYNKKF